MGFDAAFPPSGRIFKFGNDTVVWNKEGMTCTCKLFRHLAKKEQFFPSCLHIRVVQGIIEKEMTPAVPIKPEPLPPKLTLTERIEKAKTAKPPVLGTYGRRKFRPDE